MRIVVAVAQVQIELARGISELQELIERVRGLRYLIPGPSEISIVCIGRKTEFWRRLPCHTKIDTAFILRPTTITITLGIERGIFIRVESLESHHAQLIGEPEVQGIDGGDMA